jgi:hypothetical protein
MIKEIIANIKTEDLEIMFRMDSGYFDEDIVKIIESLVCKYLIKGKEYPTLASQVMDPSILFVKGDEGRETVELVTKLNTWDKDRRFVVSRILKPEKERAQLSLLEGDEYEYFFFVTNTELSSEKVVISYEKRGNCENYIEYPAGAQVPRRGTRKPGMIWRLDICYRGSVKFSTMML